MSNNETSQSILQTVSEHLYSFKRHHPDICIDFRLIENDIPTEDVNIEIILRRFNYNYARFFTVSSFCVWKDWTQRFDAHLNEMYEKILEESKTDVQINN